MNNLDKNSKIYIAGHRGLAGSAILRSLQSKGYTNIVYKTHGELDLTDHAAVKEFFKQEQPEYVFLAAAKVGGIMGNKTYPADYIYQNLEIQNNVIFEAHENKVKKLLFLGSSCIYPKLCPQPMKEEYFLTGPLEYTNEAYAVAKIAGLMMCKKYKEQYGDNFISAMPTNLYGMNDNFDPFNSHVIPGLIRKFVESAEINANKVEVWGTGSPLREFMFADDLGDALVFLMENYDGLEHINVGSGEEISIKELAELIKEITRYKGEIFFDNTKPDGTPRKLLDTTKLRDLGWEPKTDFHKGLEKTIEWFKENY